jgi:methionyl-tRNA formyltransferase
MSDEWWPDCALTVVVDNPSWVLPWAEKIVEARRARGANAALVRRYDDIAPGGVALFLGCTGIAPQTFVERSRRSLVIHESDLPKGRGFAPMTWQTLEGKLQIPVCLIEAGADVDSGPIVCRKLLHFQGHELVGEMRAALGALYCEMMDWYFDQPHPPVGVPQTGEGSVYRRRRPPDSRLDPERTIAAQFELLRVVDNENYPAFFEYRGHTYRLRIDKIDGLPGKR